MHPSVCALRRIHLPLQGRLCKRFSPKRLPCKGSCRRQPTEGCCALSCRYPSGPPLGVCGSAGFPGRCKHRPLRTRSKALPEFAGYPWGRAAMHPSVCALRRIHRPVCGARIARRALKHACALRPLHLLRLAFSAAGGARVRSPLQGRLFGGNRHPEGSPVRGAVGVSRLRGAAPCLTNTLPGCRAPPRLAVSQDSA